MAFAGGRNAQGRTVSGCVPRAGTGLGKQRSKASERSGQIDCYFNLHDISRDHAGQDAAVVRESDFVSTGAPGQWISEWIAGGRERCHVGGVRGPLTIDRDHRHHQDDAG
nr:hypothetical protein [Frankia sp. Cj3]